MRYNSFNTRDYLLLENMKIKKGMSILEIGVGLGSIIDEILKRGAKYCGIDIADKTIDYLKSQYTDSSLVRLFCMDVCSPSSDLNNKFDIIISADTLEHVDSPQLFFNFIQRHLKSDGVVLLTFPNESKEKHHGITWFEKRDDIFNIIEKANLGVERLCLMEKTVIHGFFHYYLWELPKSLFSKNKGKPQVFDETEAFEIISSHGIKAKLFALYAYIVTKITMLFPLYKYVDAKDVIKNKVLLFIIKGEK